MIELNLEFGEFMRWEPDEEFEHLIDDLVRDYNIHKRKGIHASDVCNPCLRQAYYNIIHPEVIGELTAGIFVVGEGLHAVLQKLLRKKGTPEKEVVSAYGLQCHIDVFIDHPIEIKTTRSLREEISDKWVNQLKLYMAVTNSLIGTFVIVWMNAFMKTDKRKRQKMITARKLILTKEELKKEQKSAEKRTFLLKRAVDNKDPSILFPVKYNQSSAWMCKMCPFWDECNIVD